MSNTARLSTTEAIVEAGFGVLSKSPGATLSEVAIAAGVGRATLHRYFPSRQDLLKTLAFQAVREIESASDKAAEGARSYTDAMRRILFALVPYGPRHLFLFGGIAEQYPEIEAELARMNADFRRVIVAAQKEGLFAKSCPIEWIEQSYDAVLLAAWQLVNAGDVTPKQAASLAWSTFASGVKKARM